MTTVQTPTATIHGTTSEGIAAFTGIAYATAGRFERPTPVGLGGVVDATRPGPQCPQVLGMLEQAMGVGDLPMSEDCLVLNVFTAAGTLTGLAADARRPVLVWIHGGAFLTGTGSMPWYDGSSLVARGDVVVVTINYRLGAFGYLGTSNLGTRDQLCALDWVQEHIAHFGGNPGNVTVFGESAGGSSLLALMAAPGADQRFQRAWAMSPSITQLRSADRAEQAAKEFLAVAGAADIEALHALSHDELLAAQQSLVSNPDSWATAFSPAVDGDLYADSIVKSAATSGIPLVIGTTRDEMQLFNAFNPAVSGMSDEGLLAAFAARFGDLGRGALEVYRAARPGASNGVLMSAMQTDETFRVPARRAAVAAVGRGADVWSYWFTHASTAFGGVLGSCHGIDIPFAFHNLDKPGVPMFLGDSDGQVAAAEAFSGALLRFAQIGDPGWDRYSVDDRATMQFGADSAVVHDPEPVIRELWEGAR